MNKMHTLTVNGNAYQISDPEAVSFAAAQGLTQQQKAQARQNIGIGGQYELIEEITLTEDVARLVRATDTNGVPYDFSAVRVYAQTPTYAGAFTSWQLIFDLRKADGTAMVYHQVSEALNAKKTAFVARNDNGMVDYNYASAGGSTEGILKVKPSYITEPWENVVRINLATYPEGTMILAGTQIKIYAIRG